MIMANVVGLGTILEGKYRYRLDTFIAQGGLAQVWLGAVLEPT